MLNKSRVRLNVAGETDIGAGMKGFGFWEAEQGVKSSAGTSTEQETTFKQRHMYVGMKGDFGSLSFGRQNTAGVQISDMSDIGTFTGDQKASSAQVTSRSTTLSRMVMTSKASS